MSLRGALLFFATKQSPTMRRLLRREVHPPRNDIRFQEILALSKSAPFAGLICFYAWESPVIFLCRCGLFVQLLFDGCNISFQTLITVFDLIFDFFYSRHNR